MAVCGGVLATAIALPLEQLVLCVSWLVGKWAESFFWGDGIALVLSLLGFGIYSKGNAHGGGGGGRGGGGEGLNAPLAPGGGAGGYSDATASHSVGGGSPARRRLVTDPGTPSNWPSVESGLPVARTSEGGTHTAGGNTPSTGSSLGCDGRRAL